MEVDGGSESEAISFEKHSPGPSSAVPRSDKDLPDTWTLVEQDEPLFSLLHQALCASPFVQSVRQRKEVLDKNTRRSSVFDSASSSRGDRDFRNRGVAPFVGSLPTALSRRMLSPLGRHPDNYLCFPKSDGERFFLVSARSPTGERILTLQARNGNLFVSERARERKVSSELLVEDVLDGELLQEEIHPEKSHPLLDPPPPFSQWVFAVFDALMINGQDCSGRAYQERLESARHRLESAFLGFGTLHHPWGCNPPESPGMCLYVKRSTPGSHVHELLDHIHQIPPSEQGLENTFEDQGFVFTSDGFLVLPQWFLWDEVRRSRQAVDGMVLCPARLPYYPGHLDDIILKWKPPDMHTCDLFLLENNLPPAPGPPTFCLSILEGEGLSCIRNTYSDPLRISHTLQELCNHVVECLYSEKHGDWLIVRVRKDKIRPNFFTTAMEALQCRLENIQEEDLLEAMGRGNQGNQ